jgi:hypothetical protein
MRIQTIDGQAQKLVTLVLPNTYSLNIDHSLSNHVVFQEGDRLATATTDYLYETEQLIVLPENFNS